MFLDKYGIADVSGKEICVVCSKELAEESLKPNKLQRHIETYANTTTVRETFPGGIHKNPTTFFKKLKEIEIVVPTVTVIFSSLLVTILKRTSPKNRFLIDSC